jgi:tRNA (adenine22-N1)-methyltransferase
MKTIRLSERLMAAALLVAPGQAVADVGTDHGYIPIWLVQTGVTNRVIASDINKGPLENARRSAALRGAEGIEFRLCEGLSGIRQDEADAVIIAGMGGETIASIIGASGWDWRGKSLILQPMTKQAELICRLYESGFSIEEERFAQEKDEIYRIIKAVWRPQSRRERPSSTAALAWGVRRKAEGKAARRNKGPRRGAGARRGEDFGIQSVIGRIWKMRTVREIYELIASKAPVEAKLDFRQCGPSGRQPELGDWKGAAGAGYHYPGHR